MLRIIWLKALQIFDFGIFQNLDIFEFIIMIFFFFVLFNSTTSDGVKVRQHNFIARLPEIAKFVK